MPRTLLRRAAALQTAALQIAALQVALLVGAAGGARAQTSVTTPVQFFGHEIGADYVLPDYTQLTAYWKKLSAESDRMKLVEIGRTAEDRPQYMAIISAPANLAKLEHYREISQKLAHAEIGEEEARALAKEGKAVVWIDGGLHATEVLGAEQLIETVFELNSRTDPETTRILNDVIVLAVQANPDGMELVSDWYMREPDPMKRSTSSIPVLYQKYVGHDNNRDFYGLNQPETRNMSRIMFREWFPQIVYNHHQTGPTGAVMFSPPFRDPFNYVYDPIVVNELDMVGAAMHTRFDEEGKGGVTTRSGANYSTWWNGGLRTAVYFHNMVGLLTETIGNPTPINVPFVPNMQLPHGDLPLPVTPGPWHFRTSVDYSLTANYAVLDFAQRYRETLLYNFYTMGRNSIERGSRDTWTVHPKRIDQVRDAIAADQGGEADAESTGPGGLFSAAPDSAASARYLAMVRSPDERDPRGYILPSDQPDFPTATKFVDRLMMAGITVHRATSAFTVAGKQYPAGSFVVRTDQAFRPYVLDMFEPQDHPNDFRYPGGPPVPPYDNAGWTLAFQMGVQFDRILDGFDGPFAVVKGDTADTPAGRVATLSKSAGYVLSPRYNDAFHAANALMRAGETVYRLKEPWKQKGVTYEAGTYFIPAGPKTLAAVRQQAKALGVSFAAVASKPKGEQYRLSVPRIALWDRYGGSIPSGWTRWLLEQWGYDFDVVYAQQLDAGDLRSKYDVIVFVDGAIPANDRPSRFSRFFSPPDSSEVPEQYWPSMGSVSVKTTVPQLRTFLEHGGSVITIGSSTVLAKHLGLPVGDKLVTVGDDGKEHPLAPDDYYIPGSLLTAAVDNTQPDTWGMDSRADFFFDNSPVFVVGPEAEAAGIRRLAWFDSDAPLHSGWAWGQKVLNGGTAAAAAPVGSGTLYLFGPEILFRAQPHGTFKLFFNAVDQSAATLAKVR